MVFEDTHCITRPNLSIGTMLSGDFTWHGGKKKKKKVMSSQAIPKARHWIKQASFNRRGFMRKSKSWERKKLIVTRTKGVTDKYKELRNPRISFLFTRHNRFGMPLFDSMVPKFQTKSEISIDNFTDLDWIPIWGEFRQLAWLNKHQNSRKYYDRCFFLAAACDRAMARAADLLTIGDVSKELRIFSTLP